MKKDLELRLLTAAKSGHFTEQLFGEVFQEYSSQISQAINPISPITAPFIIAALEIYKRQISAKVSGSEEAAQNLIKDLPVQCITIPVKRGGLK